MNKTSKFLAFMGIIASATTYLAYKVTGSSSIKNKNSSRSQRSTDNDSPQRETSISNENDRDKEKFSSYSDDRTQLMYKNLGMTKDQRRRFEEDYYAIMGDWEKNNPNLDMDDQQKEDSHTAALKAVLNEAQYAMYREKPRK